MAETSNRLVDRIDTRSFIAISLTLSMIALTFVLALRGPETDAFKVLLGAMLTVGFASAIGWYFNSNAGSEKKDAVSAKVAEKLAEKVMPSPAPVVVVAWWSLLSDAERTAITAAAPADAKVAAFMAAAQTGKATPEDLADLVSKGLLTQARADEIKAI